MSTLVVSAMPVVRGRHRVAGDTHRTGIITTAAVAAGALLATGYQIGNPSTADATPVVDVQAVADSIVGGIPLPPEVQDTIDNLNQSWQNLQNQYTPQAPVVRPVDGVITSGFGSRWGAMHWGLDFADPIGTPIKSVADGTVIEAGPASGFGLWVRVRHDDGTVSVYGHVNDILSRVGQRVNAGQTIATVGNRGNSTGPHLHLEIWEPGGRKIDPLPWLASHGVPMQWGPSNA